MKTTMKTTVIAFRTQSGWTLGTYSGGHIPANEFPTLSAAREYATSRGWSVRRASDCDQHPTPTPTKPNYESNPH